MKALKNAPGQNTIRKNASKLLQCSLCQKIKEHLFTVAYFLCKSINTKEVTSTL